MVSSNVSFNCKLFVITMGATLEERWLQLYLTIYLLRHSFSHRSNKSILWATHMINTMCIFFSTRYSLVKFYNNGGCAFRLEGKSTLSHPVATGTKRRYCGLPMWSILQGQVVSINKTSSDAADMKFLVIRELKVFGYEPGKGVYIIVKLFLTTNTIFPYTGLNPAQGPRESDPSWGSDLPIRPPAPKDHAGQALGLSVC